MRHSSFLEVNLSLLGENFQKIQNLAPQAEILPMVKADAYGNGLIPVAQFLSEECAIKTLGCASLGEALRLFQELPYLKSSVMVFSDTEITSETLRRHYSQLNITPVLHRKEEVDIFLSSMESKRIPLVLKVNTGMNRLGLSFQDLKLILPKIKARGVDHLMTHFACSYYPFKEQDKTHRQLEEFSKALELLRSSGVEVRATSVSNSGAIEQGIGIEETFVRPGLMLYGPPSVASRIWQGHQISRFVTKILSTFMVKKGTPVGYGIHVAGEDGFMVILPVGYGDGILTFFSGLEISLGGYRGKIFGRVNMDMTFVMFPPEVEGKLKEGMSVEIWNHDNRSIADIADQMKTHAYQVMCGITGRIPRIYKIK
jgi:alanine racemase